ncbi:MAG: dipeptidase [Acetobacteraceae bacterium]|nr:dipeptidase [Acetobacteraceae bacterium]
MSVALVDAWMQDNRQRLLDELFDLIRCPSVSTDPAYAQGMQSAAALLQARLVRIGMRDVQLLNNGGHSAVFAQWTAAPGKPTILVYGHYDVQPPDPLEDWSSPPFEPTLHSDRYVARGASDDKSPLWIALSGVEAWLAVTGGLPLNVKILLEGEEEIGSRSLPGLLERHRDLLAADVLVSADGGRWRPGTPSVNTNSRGNIGMEVHVRTAAHDLHSGRYGGPVGNAAMVLARLLATLHDGEGRIAVPRFMDGLQRPSNSDYASMEALGFDEPKFFAEIGAAPGAIEPGVRLLESLWLRPTIEVNGITGGYQGVGGKTVIPATASAKITCRLGPGQDPHGAGDAVEAHLRRHCPAWAAVEVVRSRDGTPAYAVPEDDRFLAAIERVIAQVHGRKPLRVGVGGTLPISAMVKRQLGLETVMLSYAIADENIHAPNEFFRLSSFDDGLRAWARALPELAAV